MRHVAIVSVLVSLVAGVAVTAPPAEAAAPISSDTVAYLDHGDLHVAQEDGSDQRLVAPDVTVERWASDTATLRWTPDGTAVDVCGRGDLVRVDVASGQQRDLGAFCGVVSPDGRWRAHTDADHRLWVQDLRTGEQRLLVGGAPGFHGQAAWSPDSSRIAFTGLYPDEQASLHVVDVASGAIHRLTPPEVEALDPAWSPDGRSIAVAVKPHHSTEPYRLQVVDPATGARRQVADEAARRPAWSPDGTRIAVVTTGSRPGVVQASGGAVEPVASENADTTLDWSADGTALAFVSVTHDSAEDVVETAYTVDLASGRTVRVAHPGEDPSFAREAAIRYAPGITQQVAGATRVETAAGVSRATFPSADTVVLARADRDPDALAGAPLAAVHGAPLLLTGTDALHPVAAEEIARLGASRAILLGDRTALSDRVATDLGDRGLTVTRVAGADRFATARAVAQQMPTHAGERRAFVVAGAHHDPGRGWPDAVAAAGLAAYLRDPLLLVTDDRLPSATLAALQERSVTRVTIVGGTAAVSEGVQRDLEQHGFAVDRLAGGNRYATSVVVANAAVGNGASPATTWLTTGRNWPDALASAPAVAAAGGVLLLDPGDDTDGSSPALRWLSDHAARVSRVPIAGGPDVVAPSVRVSVERLLRP